MPAYLNSNYSVAGHLLNADGSDADLTSYDLGMRWYRSEPSRKSPVVITQGNGITVEDPTSGEFTINLTVSQVCELGIGSIRVELYKNYSTESLRKILYEGTEIVEGHRVDA